MRIFLSCRPSVVDSAKDIIKKHMVSETVGAIEYVESDQNADMVIFEKGWYKRRDFSDKRKFYAMLSASKDDPSPSENIRTLSLVWLDLCLPALVKEVWEGSRDRMEIEAQP